MCQFRALSCGIAHRFNPGVLVPSLNCVGAAPAVALRWATVFGRDIRDWAGHLFWRQWVTETALQEVLIEVVHSLFGAELIGVWSCLCEVRNVIPMGSSSLKRHTTTPHDSAIGAIGCGDVITWSDESSLAGT